MVPRLSVEKLELEEGDNAALECNADDNGPVIWFLNIKDAFKIKNIEINGNSLIIKNATLDLNGFITCRVRRNETLTQNSAKIVVKSKFPNKKSQTRYLPE